MAERILLIKLSALGDVIQTLPTLEAIREAHPQAEITWLVEEAAAPVLAGHPALDNILVSRRRTWVAARRSGDLAQAGREFGSLVAAIRQHPFDLVLDLQGLFKSAMWTTLARSSRKIGFDRTREFSYLALTERLPPYDPDEHAVQRYLRTAHYLGAPQGPATFRLALPLGGGGLREPPWRTLSHPLVILHPGARWETKLWPEESFARLADELARKTGAQIVFTGSSNDRPLIGRIRSRLHRAVLDLSGRTTVKELARLMYQADAVVTTDTGPMHLAAAVGAPLVALFGPTAPWRTGPFGPHQVIRTGIRCSPCFRRRCPQPECMNGIAVADVLPVVEQVLETAGRQTHRRLPPHRTGDGQFEIIVQRI
ncbi:lipopolysaccharide heptosyltransferase I [Desulfobacca acetoxidans]|uniref:Lipopolysaccharide heptosyltransferase 1 n=1 Tax=Desulfobacca acetoxidans (strain ATCC 700848 / DSM 11109 / ASRB2) TaxID=880072 RepID=F2NC23_DESAR|nr:lipopolysaccharide heptosyltransferase I [Desulfobacca acetoxidans]AEB08818.1 lipopolysaccharide heptosyltransferase I [Desulfobacca acetoxidans DSM 11109]